MSHDDVDRRETAVEAPPRIFMSYRRDDSQGFARSIHDRLAQHFGADAVFRDINDIEPGMPWEEAIDEALASCDVFVLLIGSGWLEATDDDGQRRIDDPQDRHRREIETAINRRVRMFVALMEDAHMPRHKQLPGAPPGEEAAGIQKVSALHALRIADHAFDYGIGELITNIERATEAARVSTEQRQREEAANREADAGAERLAAEQRAREDAEAERKRVEAEAELARQKAEAEQVRDEATPTRLDERPKTGEGATEWRTWSRSDRRRQVGKWAAIGLGAVVVVVAAFLILSGGDDDSAVVDGAPIGVGNLPVDLAFGEGGLWVTNRLDGSLSFVAEGESPESADTTTIGGAPEGLAFAAGSIFVADGGGNSVLRIDPDGVDVVDEIDVGLEPGGVAVNEEAVWVANSGSNTVARISEDGVQSIPVEAKPFGVATGAEAVWVTNRGDGTVSRIDTSARQAGDPIPVGANPKGIAVGDDAVWVANTDDDTVSRIDLQSLTAGDPIDVGAEPRGVVSAFGSVWVANGGSDSVSRIDPETEEVVQTIDVGAGPEGITAGPDSIWVANGGEDTVTRITP